MQQVGLENELVVAVITATTPAEAVRNIIEVVNEFLDSIHSTHIGRGYSRSKFYWIVYELQLLMMHDWRANHYVGIFWIHFCLLWRKREDKTNDSTTLSL